MTEETSGAVPHDADPEAETDDALESAAAALEEVRRRLIEVPAEVVITNHVMGLYELAAIHLSAPEPDLPSAVLAIDAVACLVEGLGDRLGPDTATMRDALANIRLAFVQIKSRTAKGDSPDGDAEATGASDQPDPPVEPEQAEPPEPTQS